MPFFPAQSFEYLACVFNSRESSVPSTSYGVIPVNERYVYNAILKTRPCDLKILNNPFIFDQDGCGWPFRRDD